MNLDPDLISSLREQDEHTPQPDWDAMELRLLDAFANHRVTREPRRWRWVAAAAVVVLTAGASWRFVSFAPVAPTRSATETPHVETPRLLAATALVPPAAAAVPMPVAGAARVHPPRARRAPADDATEQFAGFATLPGAGALPDFESGHIVRIEVPVAGLPAYGWDLVPDATPAVVLADLLVGQDGVPRAIRLASTNQ